MNDVSRCAEVILPFPVGQTFTYLIPKALLSKVQVGMRVIVPFGKKRFYSGIVDSINLVNGDTDKLKEIDSLPDEQPLINQKQLDFWKWMADYYLCSLGEVFKAALPAGLKLESETRLLINDFFEFKMLKNENQKILYRILSSNPSASIDELSKLSGIEKAHSEVIKMMDTGALIPMEKVSEKFNYKTELFVHLRESILHEKALNSILDKLTRAEKQKEALIFILDKSLNESGEISKKELKLSELAESFGHQALRSLIRKEILVKIEKRIHRVERYTGSIREPFQLNDEQSDSLEKINTLHKTKNVVLLHGITSSGKTEIYIHLIREVLKKGQQVLYLLPEIALTSQIVVRLQEVFGNQVGIYHSKFSDSERVEVYRNLGMGGEQACKLILGVRSAVFLPFDNLGLIIVDEEHENTFKQFDPAPRYNARDASIVLAGLHNAKVLLGTATPSIESFYNAKNGKYGLVSMKKRFGDVLLPEILLADLRKARLKKEMKSVFTPVLLRHIEEELEKGKQIILFQNRRGYSSFIECEVCGWIPRCKTCDVSFTYHKYTDKLECHYCGATAEVPSKCDECSSSRLSTRGFGTELVEDEIELLFPGTRVARLDLDAARSRKNYEQVLYEFAKGKTSILVGTQMLSKGLDFENVSLVGVLNADTMLNYPDFRAHERSFQLMSQVSGRAGRKKERGKVIIQTSDPSHPVIGFVKENNFDALYRTQIEERQAFAYPPFVRMIKIIVRSKDKRDGENVAGILAIELRRIFGKRVLGPQAPLVGRIKSYYLNQIILKIERKASFSKARNLISEAIQKLEAEKKIKNVRINIDVDPY
jgi:primosomal protein N' (replication factor Y) (superfamily II helicase)